MEQFEIEDKAHALIEELMSFGFNRDTVERAFKELILAERAKCVSLCKSCLDLDEQDKAERAARKSRQESDKTAELHHLLRASHLKLFNKGIKTCVKAIESQEF